ncbi:MAG: prohibitin family protein [Lyngbya sp. HA4199-MV5]|jgi:regulator of protease activity HflC (stomatin/prohibitin superfamily)|nr:prohibitin family protein [Lyngbya sp. HA4199-MV5]
MTDLLDPSNQSKSAAPSISPLKGKLKSQKDAYTAAKVILLLLLLALVSSFFVIVNAGERGVLMTFGEVQEAVLGEGIHPVIPLVQTVQKLSVRVQSHQITAEASSKDLQDVYTDVALNWHLVPEKANVVFQRIGNESAIVESIINPAVEEVLKAVMAMYTAEEIITKRGDVKTAVDRALTERLTPYDLAVDDISLVHVHFTRRFSDAVEAKQVAEQEAKRAEFVALKAVKEAEARVNLAKGDAEAQRLLRENLTPELLQRQAIEKWNGNLPFIVGGDGTKVLDLKQLIETSRSLNAQPK